MCQVLEEPDQKDIVEGAKYLSGLWIRIHFCGSGSSCSSQCGSGSSSLLNADPDPQITSRGVEKETKDCSKVKTNGFCPHLLNLKKIKLKFLLISLHFFCFFLQIFLSWI